ncbi:MAG: hypothetical protein AAF587_39235 [Bacteroidota bacterium]
MNSDSLLQQYNISIPTEASNFQAYTEDGIDHAVWVYFDLPVTKTEAFILNNHLTEHLNPEFRAMRNFHLRTQAWWTPDAYENFRSGSLQQESVKPFYGLSFLIGEKNEQTNAVFLFVTSL